MRAVVLFYILNSLGLASQMGNLLLETATKGLGCFDSEVAVLCGAAGACTQNKPCDTHTIEDVSAQLLTL